MKKLLNITNLSLILSLTLTGSCKDTVVDEQIVEVQTPTTQPVCRDTSEREPSPYHFGGIEELSLVSEYEQTAIKVKWNNIIGQTSSGSYHVFFITQNGLTFKKSVNSPRDNIKITGLHADTEYTVLVRMMDERGRIDLNEKTLKIKTQPWPDYENTKSLKFNGVNQRIDLGASDRLLSTPRLTISAWVKPFEQHTPHGRIITLHRAGSPSTAISVGLEDDKVFFEYHNKDEILFQKSITSNYADGNWHHVAVTYNNTWYALYVDGVRVLRKKDTNYGIGHHNAYLGTYKYANSTLYKGLMDEVSVWRSALGKTDIEAIYNNGTPTNLRKHKRVGVLKTWYRMGDHAQDNETRIFDQMNSLHGTSSSHTAADFTLDTP